MPYKLTREVLDIPLDFNNSPEQGYVDWEKFFFSLQKAKDFAQKDCHQTKENLGELRWYKAPSVETYTSEPLEKVQYFIESFDFQDEEFETNAQGEIVFYRTQLEKVFQESQNLPLLELSEEDLKALIN